MSDFDIRGERPGLSRSSWTSHQRGQGTRRSFQASGRVYPGRLGLPINAASALSASPFYPGRLGFVVRPSSAGGEDGRVYPGRSLRRGISLIEVMVAMLVALIGVFGVFVLIAFAVRQVEIGMNEEAAQTLARNAMSDFEAQGFQDVVIQPVTNIEFTRWGQPEVLALGDPFYSRIPKDAATDQFFCIDPWGWAQFLPTTAVDPFSVLPIEFREFPFFAASANAPPPASPFPTFPRITLFDRNSFDLNNPIIDGVVNTVFSRALARRLYSGHDDLVTDAPTDDFSGPTQNFFSPNGGRQYAGRLTWQTFVKREADIDDYARYYAAVSLRRNHDKHDRVFEVTLPITPTTLSGGGDLELTEINGTQTLDSTFIRRGLWMMLLSKSVGGIEDVAFCRVLESDLKSNPTPPSRRVYDVTLQGSDLAVDAGSSVFAVLLPDVIAVYERTMKFETSSDWNAN